MFRTVLLGTLVVASACSKSKDETPPPAPPTTTAASATAAVPTPPPVEAPVPAIPAPAGLFTCKAPKDAVPAPKDARNPWALPFAVSGCPSIPSIYGSAAFGMDRAAAGKAVKGSKVDGGSGYLYVGKTPFKQQLTFRFSDAGTLETFAFKIDAAGFEQLKAAWGEPVMYKHMSDELHAWYNPAAKIKVTAEADTWNRANPTTRQDEDVAGYRVYVVPYLPLADLLGPEGFVAKPLIGKTVAEVAAAYPDHLEVKTKEQAKAATEKLGLDKDTVAKMDALGAGGASANLMLPPTETKQYHTLIQPDWTGGKMTSYSFLLPFGKDAALKQEILAQVAASLGKPTAATAKDEYTFTGPQGTVITLELGTLEEDWRLRVAPKS